MDNSRNYVATPAGGNVVVVQDAKTNTLKRQISLTQGSEIVGIANSSNGNFVVTHKTKTGNIVNSTFDYKSGALKNTRTTGHIKEPKVHNTYTIDHNAEGIDLEYLWSIIPGYTTLSKINTLISIPLVIESYKILTFSTLLWLQETFQSVNVAFLKILLLVIGCTIVVGAVKTLRKIPPLHDWYTTLIASVTVYTIHYPTIHYILYIFMQITLTVITYIMAIFEKLFL